MTSPWPDVERSRNRALTRHKTGRVFSYHQCVEKACGRWFPSERAFDVPSPQKCPLHDEAEQARRKANAPKRKRAA
jgi:hypothetical protein